jgi:repressor LexA
MSDTVRPTKKQRELLNFIEHFIGEHGYSPSYREIMSGLNYTSVATVALHVNNLIKRGHLHKREHSARSLEVTNPGGGAGTNSISDETTPSPSEEKWLSDKVEYLCAEAEQTHDTELNEDRVNQLSILIAAMKIIGMESAAQEFMPRIAALRERLSA